MQRSRVDDAAKRSNQRGLRSSTLRHPGFRASRQAVSLSFAGGRKKLKLDREASMKTTMLAVLVLGSTLAAGTAVAQPAPFNEVGVTMGHWHLISKDPAANQKLFTSMGG